ncbi:hypothetical protein Ahy_B03g066051 isoform D [Arachis hypogaea]|uniref:Uncharacterized protein n=1 Tax=Arachis hypogaea TaxID=3818 RepID=A0A445A360_ARAHY|nr:hypothetical protein Ahy_B03g066051 isoform D [Arachis hypogaea]
MEAVDRVQRGNTHQGRPSDEVMKDQVLLQMGWKGSSGLRSQGACTEFQDCMFDRGLTDLGYDGWPFTWRRGNLVEWLDRGLGNITWQIRFSDAKIKHLSMLKSDNSPLCLQISTMPPPNRERIPFKFLASWLFHPDFSNVISDWDVDKLNLLLPIDAIKRILAMAPPSSWRECDQVA